MEISDYEMPEPQPSEALRDAMEDSWRSSEHDGKVAHIRQDDAEAAAALLRWEHPDTNFNVYLCHFGHHWHVGRNRSVEERLERKAEALEEAKMKLRMSPQAGGSTLNRIPLPEEVREYIQSYQNKRDKAAEDAGIGITFLERSLHGEVRAADWRSENLARAVESRRHLWEGKREVAAVVAVFQKQEEREAAAVQIAPEALVPDFWDVPLQVCSRCSVSYPHTVEFFQRTAAKDGHLHTMCRNCNLELGKLGRNAALLKSEEVVKQAQKDGSAVESVEKPATVSSVDSWVELAPFTAESAPDATEAINQGGAEMPAFGEMRTALQLMGEALDRCEAEMGKLVAENAVLRERIQKWEATWDKLAGLRWQS